MIPFFTRNRPKKNKTLFPFLRRFAFDTLEKQPQQKKQFSLEPNQKNKQKKNSTKIEEHSFFVGFYGKFYPI